MKKEQLTKFYLSYRLYIFPAVVVLSSLILIIFVIYPQIINLISNQKVAGDLKNKSKFLEVKAQALENYDQVDLSGKVNSVLSSYPSDKDYGTVIGLIQSLSSQAGFIVTTISLGNSTNKLANAQTYSVKLDLSGPKSLLPVLFSGIESSPRLMRISDIEVTNTQDSQVVNVSLNLDVLFSPLPTSFGNTDSPLPELSQKEDQILTQLARNTTPALTPSNVTLPPRGKANPFE